MKHRNNYTEIEDFLSDTSFQFWVHTKEDQQSWEEWTLESPKRAKLVQESRLCILAMKVSENNTTDEMIDSAFKATLHKVNNHTINSEISVIKIWNKVWFSRIAAVLFFGLFSSIMYQNYFKSDDFALNYNQLIEENVGNLVEHVNNSKKDLVVTLSDGSSVLLKPNSKLSYPEVFAKDSRKVYLSGEGFFEISKNPKRPFFVYANEIITKVVGTSFRIKAFSKESNIEVLVRTGIVKVKSNTLTNDSKNTEVSLLPNQALRFSRKDFVFNKITNITQDKSIIKTTVGNIEQLSFEFTDIPVSQIFKTLEQAYSVNIEYPENKLKECYLTASLSDQPLPEKLKIICLSLGKNTNYTMNANQIIINSDGCN